MNWGNDLVGVYRETGALKFQLQQPYKKPGVAAFTWDPRNVGYRNWRITQSGWIPS